MSAEIQSIVEQLENLENITIHFQERGQRINVRAYAGYDRSVKRSSYVLLGSLDKHTLEKNNRLQSVVERSERIASAFDEALKQFNVDRVEKDRVEQRIAGKSAVVWRSTGLANGLESMIEDGDEISEQTAQAIYAAIKRAESALRKAGHSKNPKPAK